MKRISNLFIIMCLSTLLVGCGCNKKEKVEEKPKHIVKIENTIKDLYTDDAKLVYNNSDVYKIVYYYSGNEIIGLEHYYEYKDEKEAEKKYKEEKEEYKNNIQIKQIIRSGKFIVYIMATEQYEGKTVDEIKKSYSFLMPVYEK